jgi:hypothetical protein
LYQSHAGGVRDYRDGSNMEGVGMMDALNNAKENDTLDDLMWDWQVAHMRGNRVLAGQIMDEINALRKRDEKKRLWDKQIKGKVSNASDENNLRTGA